MDNCGGGRGERGVKGARSPRELEKRGQEAGYPMWREPGEIGGNFVTFAIGKHKRPETTKEIRKGMEPGVKVS